MKKLFICSLLLAFTLTMFGQVTVTGKGSPGNPYIVKLRCPNKDTLIGMPTNTANKMAASSLFGLDKNYVFGWQVHYKHMNATTAKVYPLQAAYPGDSLACIMAVDTTTDGLLNASSGTGNWFFEGPYVAATQYWFQYRKGTATSGWVWFIQSFKPVQ
jgi:hypothetical protein